MEPDFSGYATKAGLKCSDGRTIMSDAFKHQDTERVPLVWQHGHSDIENVIGHAILENRPDGVYCRGYFNDTVKGIHAKKMVVHGDVNKMSIWANRLIEQSKNVMHGVICEVSLVLRGANPGALIDFVKISHSDDPDDVDILDDVAIIHSGTTFDTIDGRLVEESNDEKDDKKEEEMQHGTTLTDDDDTDDGFDPEEAQALLESMSDDQQALVHSLLEEALGHAGSDAGDDETVGDIYNSLTPKQQTLVHFMIATAIEDANGSMGQSDLDDSNNDEKGNQMKRNAFENQGDKGSDTLVLSHDDMNGIFTDATKNGGGSLKEAVEAYALAHGIEDIDLLFPDAKSLDNTPELFSRRVEWVANLMSGVRKSPFSRIKTMSADLTVPEARAKGYITGDLKKEEFFRVAKRVTTPTTIYKKQKLDRDDMVDITDFDVVAWLKAEMRLMLDEELARAILVGDGRAPDDEDKVNEDSIRPIATDHELYTTTVNVNIDDAESNISEVVDEIARQRYKLRGSGLPTFYTTERYIGKFLTLRDGMNRRIYKNLAEVADEMRVKEVVPVEILEEYQDIVGILVNPTDYVVGATAGGQVSMFDDFDIDYNQYKYLIETRCSGALTKLKSAMVVKKVAGDDDLVAPNEPDFDPVTGELTITDQAGVVYRNADTDAVINAAGSPYEVASGETINVSARPAAGYYFQDSDGDDWSYTAD